MLVCKLPMHCRLQHKAKKKNHQRVSDSQFIVSVVMIPRSEKNKNKKQTFWRTNRHDHSWESTDWNLDQSF